MANDHMADQVGQMETPGATLPAETPQPPPGRNTPPAGNAPPTGNRPPQQNQPPQQNRPPQGQQPPGQQQRPAQQQAFAPAPVPRPKPPEVRGYRRSETLGKLAAALAKAQGMMGAASKDSENPHFHSKYADMASVVDAIRKPFADNGLCVLQFPNATDEGVEITTLIALSDTEEWVESTLGFPIMKIDSHGYGTGITYACRYALRAIAVVAPEEDDGNKATESAGKARDTAIKHLSEAAAKGIDAFEAAFKEMAPDVRKLIQRDLPGIREKIPGHQPPPGKRTTSVV